jgi:post-segregation antitoxin (ccd killing protein)
MSAYETASDTIVVRVGTAAKLELAERARENDRTLSAEVWRAIARHLERTTTDHDEEDT